MPKIGDIEYYYDEAKALAAVDWIQTYCSHTKGYMAGKKFELLDWQKKIVKDLFGWLRPGGFRRYRIAYIELARKNGKTFLAAALALYLLLRDNESQAEVYSVAGDQDQAKIAWSFASSMCRQNKTLRGKVELYVNSIVGKRLGGSYKYISSEDYSKHGQGPSGVIFDELHVQPNRHLWDVMITGMAARMQPLCIAITSAGTDRTSICWEMHQRALRAIKDPDSDPEFYAVVFGTSPQDDWTSEDVWKKANPSLGHAIQIEHLRGLYHAAKDNPALENTFRNLHLSQWTSQSVRVIPMDHWDKCGRDYSKNEVDYQKNYEHLSEAMFEGQPCWIGIDLATIRDVAALVMVFRIAEGYAFIPKFWMPEDTPTIQSDAHRELAMADEGKAKSRARTYARIGQDTAIVRKYMSDGLITATPGDYTDFYWIRDEVFRIAKKFRVQKVAVDRHLAHPFAQMLTNEGFPLDKIELFAQTHMNFAAPMKALIEGVISHKIRHGGNPVLRWMAENVEARIDTNGNMRPDKEASQDKIDGIVALCMGLGCCLLAPKPGSIYDTRGVLEVNLQWCNKCKTSHVAGACASPESQSQYDPVEDLAKLRKHAGL